MRRGRSGLRLCGLAHTKKNVEILTALSDLMDGPGAIIKHDEVRKVAGKESWVASFLPQLKPFVRQLWASLFKHSTGDKVNVVFKRQVWPALSWLRRFHGHQRGELVRHLFLVDQLLVGLVEVGRQHDRWWGGLLAW